MGNNRQDFDRLSLQMKPNKILFSTIHNKDCMYFLWATDGEVLIVPLHLHSSIILHYCIGLFIMGFNFFISYFSVSTRSDMMSQKLPKVQVRDDRGHYESQRRQLGVEQAGGGVGV